MPSISLIEVRSAGDAGNGCFAAAPCDEEEEVVKIKAGTTVLEATPIVWAVNDEHEARNCRLGLEVRFARMACYSSSAERITRCKTCKRADRILLYIQQ